MRQFDYVRRADGLISQFAGDRVGLLTYDGRKQLTVEGDVYLVPPTTQPVTDFGVRRPLRHPVSSTPTTVPTGLGERPSPGRGLHANPNGSILRRRRISTGEEIHYVYDGVDRLMQVRHGNLMIDYLDDCDGLLVERRRTDRNGVEVRRFHHAGQAILLEIDDRGHCLSYIRAIPGGRLLRRRRSGLSRDWRVPLSLLPARRPR